MKKIAFAIGALGMAVATVPASAATITVDAAANSSTPGATPATFAVTSGQSYTYSTSLTDLWASGSLPRWSNANGLVGDLYATGTDESGQPAGTLIGQAFSSWTQNGFTAPYGSLVGFLNGSYYLLGASGTFNATSTGTLSMFYWDENNFDNIGSIDVTIAAVPEPATWAMMIAGFGLVGGAMRRRRAKVALA